MVQKDINMEIVSLVNRESLDLGKGLLGLIDVLYLVDG